MGSRKNIIEIVALGAKTVAREEGDWPKRIEAAMKDAQANWLTTDEDECFNGAIGGLLLLAIELEDHEMEERIREEIQALQSLSAVFSGVSVNLEALKTPEKPLELVKKWKQLKKGTAK